MSTGMATNISPADIVFIREKLGLTQAELAEKVGLQRTSVTLWEMGERTPSGSSAMLLEKLKQQAKRRAEKKSGK